MNTAQRFQPVEDASKPDRITSHSIPDAISVELSSRRTGMSFQRTRMSADRTLMSVVRTSLSLISFGFTIFQFFGKLDFTSTPGRTQAVQHFSLALVVLGVAMLIAGIGYHLTFMRGLRNERDRLKTDGLIHGESAYPVSLTLLTAVLLLLIGLFAIASMVFRAGPFA